MMNAFFTSQVMPSTEMIPRVAEVRAKTADLQRIEAVLSETASRCTGASALDCAVLSSLRA